jgi:hypothetical protein
MKLSDIRKEYSDELIGIRDLFDKAIELGLWFSMPRAKARAILFKDLLVSPVQLLHKRREGLFLNPGTDFTLKSPTISILALEAQQSDIEKQIDFIEDEMELCDEWRQERYREIKADAEGVATGDKDKER